MLFAVAAFAVASHAEMSVRFSVCDTKNNRFVKELLFKSLNASCPGVSLVELKCYPHLRKRHMLEQGMLDVLPLIQSKEYDEDLIPINIPLTEGLISQRVLVAARSKLEMFENVRSLEEFRALGLAGAFGEKWFDSRVWAENGLEHICMADWNLIFAMLTRPGRNIDYFPRSVLEAQTEIEDFPDLAIVPDLLFSYDKSIIIYLSPKHGELKPVLDKALQEAQRSGLIRELLDKYYGRDVNNLELDKRTVIHLKTPE